MQVQTVLLTSVRWNPFRDLDLYPLDQAHVDELKASVHQHGFLGGVKGRRHNGHIEIACAHHRVAAARKAGLTEISMLIDEMSDDQMIALMCDENALQFGSNPAAAMAEVLAIVRRLVELAIAPLAEEDEVELARAVFDGAEGLESQRKKLRTRFSDPDKDPGITWRHVMAYLGRGNLERSTRKKTIVIEALTSLKQAGRFDAVIDEVLGQYPPQVEGETEGTALVRSTRSAPRPPKLDPRTAALFPNDGQYRAFRESVTTSAAMRVIPVSQQLGLARQIMDPKARQAFSTKQVGSAFIKRQVQAVVEDAVRAQRDIDQDEAARYRSEQREERISIEIYTAQASVRSLLSALAKLNDLAAEFPHHPKLTGFGVRLEGLAKAIETFCKHLK